jgi:hypothetical protein
MRAIAGKPDREPATTKTHATSREVKSGKNIKSSRDNSSKKLSCKTTATARMQTMLLCQNFFSNQQKPHKIVRVDSYSIGISELMVTLVF